MALLCTINGVKGGGGGEGGVGSGEREGPTNSERGVEEGRRGNVGGKGEGEAGVKVKLEEDQTNRRERGEPSSVQSTPYPIHSYAYMTNCTGR